MQTMRRRGDRETLVVTLLQEGLVFDSIHPGIIQCLLPSGRCRVPEGSFQEFPKKMIFSGVDNVAKAYSLSSSLPLGRGCRCISPEKSGNLLGSFFLTNV